MVSYKRLYMYSHTYKCTCVSSKTQFLLLYLFLTLYEFESYYYYRRNKIWIKSWIQRKRLSFKYIITVYASSCDMWVYTELIDIAFVTVLVTFAYWCKWLWSIFLGTKDCFCSYRAVSCIMPQDGVFWWPLFRCTITVFLQLWIGSFQSCIVPKKTLCWMYIDTVKIYEKELYIILYK